MGAELMSFFAQAADYGGLRAKMRLAELTRTPTSMASVLDDSPQDKNRFKRALRQIRAEFADERPSTPPIDARLFDAAPERQMLDVARDLLAVRGEFLGNRELTAERVTEAATVALRVSRAGIWLLNARWTHLECIDLCESATHSHSRGLLLYAHDCLPYFEAIASERVLDVADAVSDFRTNSFRTSYLEPSGITSLLDVPLWRKNELCGVLCSEQIGMPPREWTLADQNFALLLGQIMSMSL